MPVKRNDNEIQYRYLEFKREMVKEDGTIEMSCSSEAPVMRYWGAEILGHDPGEVRLDRVNSVGSFLFAHGRDPNYGVVPLGPIDSVTLDNADRRIKAICRFDPDEKSQLMKAKAMSGSIKGVSIGYVVYAWMEVAAGATVRGFTGPCEIAVDWEIVEVSLEPTAADPSVGVGRSEGQQESPAAESVVQPVVATDPIRTEIKQEENDNMEVKTEEQIRAEVAAAVAAERTRAIEEERTRTSGIRSLIAGIKERMPDLKINEDEMIRSNITVEEATKQVLEAVRVYMPAVPTKPNVEITLDEADKFRSAAEDALMMRSGVVISNPAPGAIELRGYSLFDMASECLERSGEKVRGNDKRSVADKALFGGGQRGISLRAQGTSDFPNILANVANKVLQKAYVEVPTTYQNWVNFADAADFKEMSRPQFSEAADLDQINEFGEYKSAEFTDTAEKYKVLTYGKKFVVSRQTIINDDLNVISRIPALFGSAAARKVNALVYAILTGNLKMADAVALFHGDHSNLAGTAAAITTDSLGDARTAMRKQKALKGKATLNIVPKFLIIPAQLEMAALKVIKSAFDPKGTNSITYNPFTELTPIVDAALDASSLTGWFLAADPSQIDTVEVAFLNGQRSPYQEQRIGFDVDGLEMKIRIDVGCKALDYRGLYKNAGV